MTDNRKEQEREELHRTIWNIANDLRGSVDGWDFKQYVLGMLRPWWTGIGAFMWKSRKSRILTRSSQRKN